MTSNIPAWVQAQIIYSNAGKFASPHSRVYNMPTITPLPIFNISEWDEVTIRHQTAHSFNWRNANSRMWERVLGTITEARR